MTKAAYRKDHEIAAFPHSIGEMSESEIGLWLEALLPDLRTQNDKVSDYIFLPRNSYTGANYKQLKREFDVYGSQIRLVSFELQARMEAEKKEQKDIAILKQLKDTCVDRTKMNDEIKDVLVKFQEEKAKHLDRFIRVLGVSFGVPSAATAIASKFYPEYLWVLAGTAAITAVACVVAAYPGETYDGVRAASAWTLMKAEIVGRKAKKVADVISLPVRRKAIPASMTFGIYKSSNYISEKAIRQRTPVQIEQRLPTCALAL